MNFFRKDMNFMNKKYERYELFPKRYELRQGKDMNFWTFFWHVNLKLLYVEYQNYF